MSEAVTQSVAQRRPQRHVKVGTVVSDKNDKTVVVSVDYKVTHPLYRRVVRRSSKFHAHDEKNECRVGDRVEIVSTRPLSKMKRWRVRSVVEKAKE